MTTKNQMDRAQESYDHQTDPKYELPDEVEIEYDEDMDFDGMDYEPWGDE